MESLQIKKNSINNILAQIDNYYMKIGGNKVNMLRFDIGKQPDLYKFKLVSGFERVLRTSLTLCELEEEISDEFLEKTKLIINKLN